MDELPEFNKPAYYEFRVRDRISSQSAAWFEGMEVGLLVSIVGFFLAEGEKN